MRGASSPTSIHDLYDDSLPPTFVKFTNKHIAKLSASGEPTVRHSRSPVDSRYRAIPRKTSFLQTVRLELTQVPVWLQGHPVLTVASMEQEMKTCSGWVTSSTYIMPEAGRR